MALSHFLKPRWWSIRPGEGKTKRCAGSGRCWFVNRPNSGALNLPTQAQPKDIAAYEQQKGQLLTHVQEQQKKLEQLKSERKAAPKHLTLKELPELERFSQLRTAQKHFVDTIHLIAYRAETALVALVREKLARSDDG